MRRSAAVVAAVGGAAIAFGLLRLARGGRRRRGRRDRRLRRGSRRRPARSGAAAPAPGSRVLVGARRDRRGRRSRSCRCSATSRRSCMPALALRVRRADARALRRPAHARARLSAGRQQPKPVVLIIIDGLTPSMLEATDAPALRFLLDHGSYRRAVSTFPSLTPGLPGVDRDRRPRRTSTASRTSSGGTATSSASSSTGRRSRRCAPPGSCRACATRSSTSTSATCSRSAETIFEALEGDGPHDRRDQHHDLPRPEPAPLADPRLPAGATGRKRFFFYSVYESDKTGAPIAFLNRSLGSIDAYAATIGRWLVTRDGFDLLVHYLPDYDYASHAVGPDAAHEALGRADAAIAALFEAAGGPDAFLERYARRPLLRPRAVAGRAGGPARGARARSSPPRTGRRCSTATIRAGSPRRSTASRRSTSPLFLEDGEVVARSGGDEDLGAARRVPGRPRPRRGRRCGTRTPARCSSPPRRAGSSSISPDAITSAAAATARSRRATPRCRCSRSGSASRRLRSPGSRACCSRISESRSREAACRRGPSRRRWIERQLRRRGIERRARPRGDGARAARAVRPGGVARASAYEDAPIPLPFGQTISQPYMVALTCEALGLAGGERVLDVGTGSGYAAAVLAELAARGAHDRADPRARRVRPGGARGRRLRAGRGPRRRRVARAARARAVRRDRRRRGRAARSRRRSGSSSPTAAGSPSRW